MDTKFTLDQLEQALATAGADTDQIQNIKDMLMDKNTYPNRATQGVDPEGQETYEPRAPAEKHWADRHTVQSFERSDEIYQDGADKMEVASEPTAPTSAPKPEVNVSFSRIKQMMSQ
jgi:hypothetical protein